MSRHNNVTAIFANLALLPEGWCENVRVDLADGVIRRLSTAVAPQADDLKVSTLLPSLGNLHSHSFQRAMAGMTEYRSAAADSFWTWREVMYRFLEHLTPEHIEAFAAHVFMEMQVAGFASVAEFHYVHHQHGGAPYAKLAEMSERILAAAAQTGIGLTLLPVLYSFGGAGEKPLAGGQLRFGNDPERFAKLHGEVSTLAAHSMPSDTRLGMAPHSLRATNPLHLASAVAQYAAGPIHMHIAEQPREVEEISVWLGARPVQWLLDNVHVTKDWCLIHATHMTAAETSALAESGAVAGLCPLTEANLGDGPFNGADYLRAGGAFGIGSDSNVRISLCQELSMLEYSQRLRDGARNVLVSDQGSVGYELYTRSAAGGAQALGRKAGVVAEGQLADLVAIDREHISLCGLKPVQLLDGWIFAGGDAAVTDLWSAGRHCVRGGRHIAHDAITMAYRKAMRDLVGRL